MRSALVHSQLATLLEVIAYGCVSIGKERLIKVIYRQYGLKMKTSTEMLWLIDINIKFKCFDKEILQCIDWHHGTYLHATNLTHSPTGRGMLLS